MPPTLPLPPRTRTHLTARGPTSPFTPPPPPPPNQDSPLDPVMLRQAGLPALKLGVAFGVALLLAPLWLPVWGACLLAERVATSRENGRQRAAEQRAAAAVAAAAGAGAGAAGIIADGVDAVAGAGAGVGIGVCFVGTTAAAAGCGAGPGGNGGAAAAAAAAAAGSAAGPAPAGPAGGDAAAGPGAVAAAAAAGCGAGPGGNGGTGAGAGAAAGHWGSAEVEVAIRPHLWSGEGPSSLAGLLGCAPQLEVLRLEGTRRLKEVSAAVVCQFVSWLVMLGVWGWWFGCCLADWLVG